MLHKTDFRAEKIAKKSILHDFHSDSSWIFGSVQIHLRLAFFVVLIHREKRKFFSHHKNLFLFVRKRTIFVHKSMHVTIISNDERKYTEEENVSTNFISIITRRLFVVVVVSSLLLFQISLHSH